MSLEDINTACREDINAACRACREYTPEDGIRRWEDEQGVVHFGNYTADRDGYVRALRDYNLMEHLDAVDVLIYAAERGLDGAIVKSLARYLPFPVDGSRMDILRDVICRLEGIDDIQEV